MEKISYVEIDLNRCKNRYGVQGVYEDSAGNVSYPDITNEMPSPFDPSGWFGAIDFDLSYTSITEANPSGESFVGEFEYIGTGSATVLTTGFSQSLSAGEYAYFSIVFKEIQGMDSIRCFFQYDDGGTQSDGAPTIKLSDGSGTLPNDWETKVTALSSGYSLLQVKMLANFSFDYRNIIYLQNVNSTPAIGDKIKLQAAFFGKADDWPAVVGFESNCTASIPATGEIKCFNGFSTCQDKPNYNKEIVTSRHSSVTAKPPIDIPAITDMSGYSIRPAILDLGESIGTRASVTMTFKDARFPDTGPEGDYYLTDRTYDPYKVGSYWGKFRARFPFIQGSDIRLIRGDSTQPLDQMETRHFIVDTVSGPDSSGTFTIVCKDALKLADGKKAQCPIVSNGTTEFEVTDVATALLLAPTGIGSEYPISGYVNIGGKEICKYTRSGDTLDIGTLGERGALGTVATAHSAGDRIQICEVFEPQRAANILDKLLKDFANVPEEYITLSDWVAEDAANIDRLYSAAIAEPTDVDKLINEVLQQTASSMWWDDSASPPQIKWSVLQAVTTTAALYNEDLILADTFSAKDQNDKRVSQVWTFYGQINPLEKLDDKSNYSQGRVIISPESEANFEGTPSIKRIFSRWIPKNGEDAATRLNGLILSRYTTPPRLVSFGLQRDPNLVIPKLGGGYNVSSATIQDATGANKILPVQLKQVKSTDTGYQVIGEEVLFTETVAPDDPNVKPVSLVSGSNQNIRTIYDTLYPDIVAGDIVNVRIESTEVIGSTSTGAPALVTGDWPAGITLNLLNNGKIVGKGGAGGEGGGLSQAGNNFNATAPTSGTRGGDALTVNYDINIENNGLIGGGGGGGGGSGSATSLSQFGGTGNGGGAGAGSTGSLGGSAGANQHSFPENVTGNAGLTNGLEIGGNGGAQVFFDAPSSFPTLVCPKGGKGGDIDKRGATGERGYITPVVNPYDDPPFISNGALGGLAGYAINENGNTVIITGTNPIDGAINP